MSKLTKPAQKLLEDRYTVGDEKTWSDVVKRSAKAVASIEINEDYYRDRFFNMMNNFDFIPNSPVLMNADLEDGYLSACNVLPVEDDMTEIFETEKNLAIINKEGGGTGFAFTRLRPRGDKVGSTGGVSSGVISFMKSFDEATNTVKQGGRRKGANMGVLRIDHPDILDFIPSKGELDKRNKVVYDKFINALDISKPEFKKAVEDILLDEQLSNFNISVGITNEFMDALYNEEEFELINPRNGEVWDTVYAPDLWKTIIDYAHKNGEPGIVFLDEINDKHPAPEEIESVNVCLTGDTKIWTIDGEKEIKDLVNNRIPVLTQDDKGKLMYKKMFNIHKTREDAEIMEIKLDSGSTVRLTPDHTLFLVDGKKKKAKDIKAGDRLLSVYKRERNQHGYYGLTNNKETVMEHWINASYKYGRRPDYPNEHCHHKDGDKQNNHLDNLEYMPAKKHRAIEMKGEKNPMYNVWNERNPLYGINTEGENNGRWRDDIETEEIKALRDEGLSYQKISDKLGCSKYTVQDRLGKIKRNHKVISVKRTNDKEDVYNGTVEDTHRFFIKTEEDGGVLSKNCGEQPLLPNESCVLGAVNLSNMLKEHDGKTVNIDWIKLQDTVEGAVRFLDNVVDINAYPLPQLEKSAKKYRKIGVGIMGWAEMLIKLNIRYGSQKSLDLADEVSSFIQETAIKASESLAEEKGVFEGFEESLIDIPRRNLITTTVAPTGSRSFLANTSGGVEPFFSFKYKHTDGDGNESWFEYDFTEEADEHALVTTMDVTPEEHILMQSAWQKNVGSAVSKTVNLPNEATFEDVDKIYKMAYETNCKGVTIYRDGSKTEQVLTDESNSKNDSEDTVISDDSMKLEDVSVTIDGDSGESTTFTTTTIQLEEAQKNNEVGMSTNLPRGYIKEASDEATAKRFKLNTGCGTLYLNVVLDENGNIVETFANSSNGGCTIFTQATSRLISLALRGGIALDDVVDQLLSAGSCPAYQASRASGKDVSAGASCAGAIALKLREVQEELEEEGNEGYDEEVVTGSFEITEDHESIFDDVYFELYEDNSDKLNLETIDRGTANDDEATCPECGSELSMGSGCVTCRSCGWSKCG